MIKELEIIKWTDCYNIAVGAWKKLEEVEFSEAVIYSVGFVVKENDNLIMLAAHLHNKHDNDDEIFEITGEMIIPKRSIIDRKVISIKEIVLRGT